jgi:catechol-2,3-dioxygenase
VKPHLKAVVLKTSRLKETQDFFETTLGMNIVESSITHFVIYAKGIRILFVESNNGPAVELYLTKKSADGLTVQEDPNQIKIIIS